MTLKINRSDALPQMSCLCDINKVAAFDCLFIICFVVVLKLDVLILMTVDSCPVQTELLPTAPQ